ncbi:lysophospholipid acyltransferase family protein [Thiobacillus sp.]
MAEAVTPLRPATLAPYNAGVIAARLPLPARRALRIGLLVLHLVWGMTLAGLLFPVLGTAARDRVIRHWSRRLLKVLGVRLRADVPPSLPSGALLVCNHVSWLDIYLIHATRRVHFVSKAEVRRWPVAGWLAQKSGTLFIERGRRSDTARVNTEMRDLLSGGTWVAIFPEGTTSDGRDLRRFMPSLLQPAVELNCPVVPAALRYYTLDGVQTTAPAYIDGVGMSQSLMNIVSEPGLVAELRFGVPLAADGHRRELAQRAEAATAELLGVARSGGAPSAPVADTPPKTPADPPV